MVGVPTVGGMPAASRKLPKPQPPPPPEGRSGGGPFGILGPAPGKTQPPGPRSIGPPLGSIGGRLLGSKVRGLPAASRKLPKPQPPPLPPEGRSGGGSGRAVGPRPGNTQPPGP